VRGEHFLLLAMAAERFGSRPSRLAGLDDPVLALDFDLAAAARLLQHERESFEKAGVPGESGREASVAAAREDRW
jgi:hypothetical protein